MTIAFLNAVKQFNDLKEKDPNGRFRSWEYCYLAFSEARKEQSPNYDYLSLQLYQYLASWGMLRGSSFLLWKDYKVHIPAIQEMMKPKYDCLQGVTCQDFLNDNVLPAWEKLDQFLIRYYEGIRQNVEETLEQKKAKNELSTILRSKILLGTLGCTPAYDRFFKKSVKKYGISSGYGHRSFSQLAEFYQKHHSAFEECRKTLKVEGTDLLYPQMKLLDMGFWQLGLNAE